AICRLRYSSFCDSFHLIGCVFRGELMPADTVVHPGETISANVSYGGATEPCAIVLFGASGDLAKRKVIPALFDLPAHDSLGERYSIIGFARTPMTDDSFRNTAGEAAKTISEGGPIDSTKWNEFAANLYYSPGDYGDQEAYAKLSRRLTELDAANNL